MPCPRTAKRINSSQSMAERPLLVMPTPVMRRPRGTKDARVGLVATGKRPPWSEACAATGSSFPHCRPINDETFRTCVEEVLDPVSKLGDITVMGKPGRHKSDAVCWAIEDRGAEPRFSRFSPDPARSSGVRQVQALAAKSQGAEPGQTLAEACGILGSIEPDECANCLKHAV